MPTTTVRAGHLLRTLVDEGRLRMAGKRLDERLRALAHGFTRKSAIRVYAPVRARIRVYVTTQSVDDGCSTMTTSEASTSSRDSWL